MSLAFTEYLYSSEINKFYIMATLQEGIYYKKRSRPGQSLGIIFLKVNKSSKAPEVGEMIVRVWNTCNNLKKGILKDLVDLKVAHPKLYDDLTVMIGFGQGIFDLEGKFRERPLSFSRDLHFEEPVGGGPLIAGSDLLYLGELGDNNLAVDDIVIQFVSNSAFVTNQCIVDIWHEIYNTQKDDKIRDILTLTRYYDGFRRSDNRSWIGFHDGVSNLKEQERNEIIAIDQSQVKPEDNWTIQGTFMAFIRMYMDLTSWWNVERKLQEIMVGRDKSTGCPIIGVNEVTGKNIIMRGCPVPGTKEVTDKGNEVYRNHPPYGFQKLSPGISDEQLKFSHIGEVRRIEKQGIGKKEQYGIFRQGYEFLERIHSYPGLRAGLNFICFQDHPNRLFNALVTKPKVIETSSMKNSWKNQMNMNAKNLRFNSFFKVGAAGIFFIPPLRSGEIFPGASIFFSNPEINMYSGGWKR